MNSTEKARIEMNSLKRNIRNTRIESALTMSASLTLSTFLLVSGGYVLRRTNSKRRTNLLYELGPAEQARHDGIQQSLTLLSPCHRIWKVKSRSENWDWKRNAGASHNVDRSVIRVTNAKPPLVSTNVQVISIDLGDSQLFFLPDLVLYRDGRGYGSIEYNDFAVAGSSTTFIEGEWVPPDAEIIGSRWQYMNKDGGPDRRFNNNRQIPVLRLGELVLTSSKGLNILIYASNEQKSRAFADCWRRRSQPSNESKRPEEQYRPPPPKSESLPNQTSAARKALGIDDRASAAEISAAYHKLAQMYHPDKVAGLAPEFQALADKRMKEINGAYELLKQKG